MFLSIIIPFYNVERYIEQCIRSVCQQNIPKDQYEVICVDDCSPDNSRQIVDKLMREYANISLITHSRNKKLGGARNTGLLAANGDYIWFVDSDDFVQSGCIAQLCGQIQKYHPDILHFDFSSGVTGLDCHHSLNIYPTVISGCDFLVNVGQGQWYDRIIGVWLCWFKRSLLIDNNIYFCEDIMYEDTDYLIKTFDISKKLVHVPIEAYCYRHSVDSITNQDITPTILKYRVLQLNRCAAIARGISPDLSAMVRESVYKTSFILRDLLKKMPVIDRCKYFLQMRRHYLGDMKSCCTFRTWVALRYAITFLY